jgi:hypothetical protein
MIGREETPQRGGLDRSGEMRIRLFGQTLEWAYAYRGDRSASEKLEQHG